MFEEPPKKDGKDSNVADLSEWRDKKIKGELVKKPKRMGRPKAREAARRPISDNQEKIIPDKAKVAADFIARFEEKFVSSLGNQIQELRKKLYDKKEYIFWINATNFSQEIRHWEREFRSILADLEEKSENKPVRSSIEDYIGKFEPFHFTDNDNRMKAHSDPWFLLEKFEELARKFKK